MSHECFVFCNHHHESRIIDNAMNHRLFTSNSLQMVLPSFQTAIYGAGQLLTQLELQPLRHQRPGISSCAVDKSKVFSSNFSSCSLKAFTLGQSQLPLRPNIAHKLHTPASLPRHPEIRTRSSKDSCGTTSNSCCAK